MEILNMEILNKRKYICENIDLNNCGSCNISVSKLSYELVVNTIYYLWNNDIDNYTIALNKDCIRCNGKIIILKQKFSLEECTLNVNKIYTHDIIDSWMESNKYIVCNIEFGSMYLLKYIINTSDNSKDIRTFLSSLNNCSKIKNYTVD